MPLPSGTLLPSGVLLPSPGGQLTEQLLQSFLPWLATDTTGSLTAYVTSLGSMLEQVFELVADQGDPDQPASYTPGWSSLLDPDSCPTSFLPYTGQFVGVTIPPGTGDADARTILKQEAGFQRGTPAALLSAAKRNLTGTQSVMLLERQGVSSPDAYHFIVVVRPEEVVGVSALTVAVNAVKPAGLQWTLVQTDGWTWNQAVHTWTFDALSWDATATTQP